MASIGNMTAWPRVRILVVDDDASIREVSAAMLTDEGYQVLTAEDGMQALEALPQFSPNLVITDLRMPRMSGFELLKILRERFPLLPVIAVSGEFRGEEIPSGVIADAFVPKGSSYMTTLETKITELLSPISSEPGRTPESGIPHNEAHAAEARFGIPLLRST